MGTPMVLVLREDPGTQNGKILFKVTHGSSWVADPELITFPSFPMEASVPTYADHDLHCLPLHASR